METPRFDEIFKQINANLRFSGIPPDDASMFGLMFYILSFSLLLMLFEEATFFVSKMSSGNVVLLIEVAPVLGIGLLSFIKMMPVAMKKKKIYKLMNRLDELYHDILTDKEKRELVTKEILLVKSLTKYYFILNALAVCFYNYGPLVYMIKNYITKDVVIYYLPFNILLPFKTDTFYTWLPVYIHSTIASKIIN